MDTYYPLFEILALERRAQREKKDLDWRTFLYYQCMARDKRYEQKSALQCLPAAPSRTAILFHVFCAGLVFADWIYAAAVWTKQYIYAHVCPECGVRGTAFIMMGGLIGLLWLGLALAVLVGAAWTLRRWARRVLVGVWMVWWLLGWVEKGYHAWVG
jgi:hypothetical protein